MIEISVNIKMYVCEMGRLMSDWVTFDWVGLWMWEDWRLKEVEWSGHNMSLYECVEKSRNKLR